MQERIRIFYLVFLDKSLFKGTSIQFHLMAWYSSGLFDASVMRLMQDLRATWMLTPKKKLFFLRLDLFGSILRARYPTYFLGRVPVLKKALTARHVNALRRRSLCNERLIVVFLAGTVTQAFNYPHMLTWIVSPIVLGQIVNCSSSKRQILKKMIQEATVRAHWGIEEQQKQKARNDKYLVLDSIHLGAEFVKFMTIISEI